MKVSAILCSDIHLRDSIPKARTDDYWKAQYKKMKWLKNLQIEYDCPVFCTGDLFHKAKSSNYLVSWTINILPKDLSVIPGQHDLPNHDIKNMNKSSMGILASIGRWYIFPTPYQEMYKPTSNIGMIHTFVPKPKDKQDKIIGGCSALSLLKKHPELDLILTGDNHKPFTYEYEGRLLVNPGSMMRMSAGQIDHKPRVYLWDAENNKVESAYYPIEENVLDRSHIEIQEKKDERMEAFINRIDESYEIGLSFEKNLESYFNKNKTRKGIKEVVWEELG